MESNGINTRIRPTDTINEVIGTVSMSTDTVKLAGSFKWEYFNRVSDIDLNETLTLSAQTRLELFKKVIKMIRHMVRNIEIMTPRMYISDFKAGEHPDLRETYWRLDYTIANPETSIIDLETVHRLTQQFYENEKIGDAYYKQIITSQSLTEIHRLYRKLTILRWNVDSLHVHSPMKVLFGNETVRLLDVIQLEPVRYRLPDGKMVNISPPGIPMIKLDIVSFVNGILMDISHILNINWYIHDPSSDNKRPHVTRLSVYDAPYPVLINQEVTQLFLVDRNYIKGFKRMWIFYMKFLVGDFTIKTNIRRSMEAAMIELCEGMNRNMKLLTLERYAGFFGVAADMILKRSYVSNEYKCQMLPYIELLENVYYFSNKLQVLIECTPKLLYNPHATELSQYITDSIENIHDGININMDTRRVSFSGSEERFRMYVGATCASIRKRTKQLIQHEMERLYSEPMVRRLVETFGEIVKQM